MKLCRFVSLNFRQLDKRQLLISWQASVLHTCSVHSHCAIVDGLHSEMCWQLKEQNRSQPLSQTEGILIFHFIKKNHRYKKSCLNVFQEIKEWQKTATSVEKKPDKSWAWVKKNKKNKEQTPKNANVKRSLSWKQNQPTWIYAKD